MALTRDEIAALIDRVPRGMDADVFLVDLINLAIEEHDKRTTMNPVLSEIHDRKQQEEIQRLREQVKYWQEAYKQAMQEVEKLSLDLGLKDMGKDK